MQAVQCDVDAHQQTFGRSSSRRNFSHTCSLAGSTNCTIGRWHLDPGLWRILESRTRASKTLPNTQCSQCLHSASSTQCRRSAILCACYHLCEATIQMHFPLTGLRAIPASLGFCPDLAIPGLYTDYLTEQRQVKRSTRELRQYGSPLQQAQRCRRRNIPRHCGGHVCGLRRCKPSPSISIPTIAVRAVS